VPANSATLASSSKPTAHELDRGTPGWQLNQQYTYDLSLTTALAFGQQVKAFDFDLAAKLLVIPTSVTPEATTLFLAFQNPKLTSRVPSTQPNYDSIAAQLAQSGCFITLSGGRVTELRIVPGLSLVSVGVYRDIGSRLQFSRPLPRADQYEVEEYDTTGKLVVEYMRDPAATNAWKKRKVRYLGILGGQSNVPSIPTNIIPRLVKSEGEIQLAADGRPLAIHQQEEVQVNGAQTPVHSSTSVSLTSEASLPAQQRDWALLANKMDRVLVGEPYGKQASVDALDDARIHGRTFDSVVAELEKLARTKPAQPTASPAPSASAASNQALQESSALFAALTAIFRRRPETVPIALAKIRANSLASDTLVDALGSSGSTSAQEALLELANGKSVEPKLRERALTSLTRTSRPSPQAIAALELMVQENPANMQALYGLGTYSRRLRDFGDAAGSSAVGDFLVDRLRLAKEVIPRVEAALTAIGNSGYDGALDRVVPYLADRGEPVRAAAVGALQSMRDPRVDQLIANCVQSDLSSRVRISALDAARVRAPSDTLTQALMVVAIKADDAHVRYGAVDLIIRWLSARPDLLPILTQVAAQDSEPRVRERAQAAL